MTFKHIAFILFAFSLSALSGKAQDGASEADYDRLDGKGTSGKKVDVVEWEGNLEIHVAPKGSLKGLSLKLDKKDKDKPVMVIGYKFEDGKRLIRRAILGITLNETFKTFRDPGEEDYDKIVITNNGLASPMVAYKLDAAPAQLYPDGHPALLRAPANDSAAKTKVIDAPAAGVDDSGTIQPIFMTK